MGINCDKYRNSHSASCESTAENHAAPVIVSELGKAFGVDTDLLSVLGYQFSGNDKFRGWCSINECSFGMLPPRATGYPTTVVVSDKCEAKEFFDRDSRLIGLLPRTLFANEPCPVASVVPRLAFAFDFLVMSYRTMSGLPGMDCVPNECYDPLPGRDPKSHTPYGLFSAVK